MKISLGTIVGLQFATRAWAQDHSAAPHTELAIPNSHYFSRDNFPDRLERRPGQIIARDQTRLLLVFKGRQTPASLQPFLNATHLVLEEPSPNGSVRSERINNSHRHFWVRKDQPLDQHSPIDQGTLALLARALGNTLDWVGPVYSQPGATGRSGHFCEPPHVLLLKFQRNISSTLPPSVAQAITAAHLHEVPNKSQFLNDYRYFELDTPSSGTVFHFYRLVRKGKVLFVEDAQLDDIPLVKTSAAVGPDPWYGAGNTGQWNLRHIHADTGWALSTGSQNVVIFVIDEGFDSIDREDGKTQHPDIRFVHHGIDLSKMEEILPANWLDAVEIGHGTACAGIAAAITNNAEGIAGAAGGWEPTLGCGIYPLFMIAPASSQQIAFAFNFAAQIQKGLLMNTDPRWIAPPLGGSVISISQGNPWSTALNQSLGWNNVTIDPAIDAAQAADIVICASSGDGDERDATNPGIAGVTYPATNPYVMACGASDQSDTRVKKSATTQWGSNYGSHLSVVAPGKEIPSTDLQDYLQTDNTETQLGYATGNYVGSFWGTSASAPHVAGLAALLRSRYALSAKQVRDIIERTAQKTVGITFVEQSGKPNGTWNNGMGYGLIDVFRALDFADVMIRDHPSDDGAEPFPLPNLYGFEQSDIVVRPMNGVITNADFDTWNVPAGKKLTDGQDNFIYVRATNRGPNTARNVTVNVRLIAPSITPNYPNDWIVMMNDSQHRLPLPLLSPAQSISANTSMIVKFTVAASDILWAKNNWGGNSFALARVTSDNDYAFQTALTTGTNLISRRNNLTMAPLSVVPSSSGGDMTPPTAPTNLSVH